jgi:hypothetical protein
MTRKTKTRINFDSTGRAIREVRNDEGTFEREADGEATYNFSGDMLNLEDSRKARRPEFNPYHGSPVGAPTKQRSKLDFMRELSEMIKKARSLNEPKK